MCLEYIGAHGWKLREEYLDVLPGDPDSRPRYQDMLRDTRRIHLAG